MTHFARCVGIDDSGAEMLNADLEGPRVCLAEADARADEVQPPPSAREYWTRCSLAEWRRQADQDDRLQAAVSPELTGAERLVAGVEGWIFGVG
jgi:hypothetical protein